jgi:hypothetical protein
MNSPYGFNQIIDWIDQALLITNIDPPMFNILTSYGVASATAFMALPDHSPYPETEVPQLFREIAPDHFYSARRVIDQNSQFIRLSSLSRNPSQSWMMEMLATQPSDNSYNKYIRYSIIQRFNNYSPLVIPASIITLTGCLLVLWTNFRAAVEQLASLIVSTALAQTGGSHIGGLPSNVRSVIACFLAFGILMTLGVCLYSGFISKKPSPRAADAVRTILSFSFGIVTAFRRHVINPFPLTIDNQLAILVLSS